MQPFEKLLGKRCSGHIGHALHRLDVGDRHDARDHRRLAAVGVELVDHPEVVVGLEEELGDAEVGQRQLLGQVAGGRSARSVERGCSSGWAATPTEKSPMPWMSCTSSMAWASSPTGASGSLDGSPPRARMFSMPASRVAARRSRRARPGCGRCTSGGPSPSSTCRGGCAATISRVRLPGGAAGPVGDRHERRAGAARARRGSSRGCAGPRRSSAGRTRTRTSAPRRGAGGSWSRREASGRPASLRECRPVHRHRCPCVGDDQAGVRRRRVRRAATVLRSSIATVVGPTPPRRGVIQPATSAHASSTSGSSLRPSQRDAAADDHGARLHHVGRDDRRLADRGDEDVGLAGVGRRGRRPRCAPRSTAAVRTRLLRA